VVGARFRFLPVSLNQYRQRKSSQSKIVISMYQLFSTVVRGAFNENYLSYIHISVIAQLQLFEIFS